ncbi:MAG: CHASE2 domain-containing protein, partial [Pseudomonadales bacterium]
MATFKGRWDFLLAAILFLLAMGAQRLDLFAALELQTQSFRQILRMADAERVFPEDKIVFVNQDEAFFEDYGSWPLRRLDVARVAENVEALGGRVMAVDNLFDFPSSYGEDGPTAEKFEGVPGLLLVSQGVVEDGRLIYIKQPVEPINGVARTGYTNVESRSGLSEVISDLRLFPEAIPMENGWPFAVQAVGLYLGETPSYDRETRVLSFGDQLSVQLDQNHRLAIDFPSFPAGAQGYVADFGIPVLEMLRLDKLEEDEAWELRFWVEDKIVILGDTSEVSHDYFETPVGRLYGVELIGATIATLLAGGALLPASFVMEAAVALGLLLALVGTGLLQNPAGRLAASHGAQGRW